MRIKSKNRKTNMIHKIKQIIWISNQIISHPLIKDKKLGGLLRFCKWQLNLRFKKEIIHPYINESKLILKKGMWGGTFNCYVGLADFEEMSFLLHFLRENDFFVDIGANIGTYTILASAIKKAKTLSIEPVKSTFSCLQKNIKINNIENNIKALNIGLGSKEGYCTFTTDRGPMNKVIGYCKKNKRKAIRVRKLDNLIRKNIPRIIKIDTEGFESEILKGAEKILNNNNLKAIIIELWKREKLHKKLLSKGFYRYNYNPFSRKLIKNKSHKVNNAIYIKNLKFVKKRLVKSKKFEVLGRYI